MRSSTDHARCVLGSGRTRLVAACVLALGLTSTPGAHALEVGATPPPIDLPDLDGSPVELEELAGKVVLIDFWASWCGPCKKEMPMLQALHERHATRGLVVIGINIDRNEKKLESFLKHTPVTFRIVHDRRAEIASRYELSTMPSTFFVGRNGKLRHVHEGFREDHAELIERRIQTLLDEDSAATRD